MGFSKAEAAKLQACADRQEKIEHDEELRKRGLMPTVADVIADTDPATEAARKLAADGVEAVRIVKPTMISGERYAPGEILLPFPTKTLPGFIRAEALDRLPADTFTRDGEIVTITEAVRITGRAHKSGDVLQLWPAVPPRGFSTPRRILDLIRSGTAEAVPLA